MDMVLQAHFGCRFQLPLNHFIQHVHYGNIALNECQVIFKPFKVIFRFL